MPERVRVHTGCRGQAPIDVRLPRLARMSTDTWFDDNNRYLAVSLQWLRLKLQNLMPGAEPDAKPALPSTDASRRSWFGANGASATPVGAGKGSPKKLSGSNAQLAACTAEREAAAKADPQPALLLLAQRLGLSAFERDT